MAVGRATERTFRAGGPGAALGVAAMLGVLALGRFGLLEAAELAVADRIGPASRTHPGAAPSAVVLVSLTEADFEQHGYPIPDDVLVELLEILIAHGATAIGVDLYRPAPASADPRDLAAFAALAETVRLHPQIVMTELLPANDAPGLPAPRFAPPEQVGFNNFLVDPGRVVRRGYLYAWDEDGTAHVSLALRLASLKLAAHGVAVAPDPDDPQAVRIGATPLAPLESDFGGYVGLDAGGYQIALDHGRDVSAFASLRLDDLLAGRVPADEIRDRIVIVGTDAPSVKDDFNSPQSRTAIVKGHRLHAQLTDQLIRAGLAGDAPPGSLSNRAETALAIGFGLAAVVIATFVGTFGVVVPLLLAGLALPFVLAAVGGAKGVWVPSVEPALAWAAAGGVALVVRARREARAQRQLASLFQRFSSREVAEELWRQREAIMDGGRPRPQRVVLTALISDLEGFTSAAEKLEPERLLEWADGFLGAMTRVIEAHGGHVDDYAGDGIKANFGVPIASETEEARARDARQAVACALAMGRALEACHRLWADRGLPLARQRIGIFTGPAVVGAVGSDARMKYTSLGDTINAAARLEGFTGSVIADGGTPDGEAVDGARFAGPGRLQRILIGEPTRRLLGDAFVVEDLGVHAVKGRSEPIHIYRVVGERNAGPREGRS